MDGLPDGYVLRRNDLAADARARAWFQAVARGFHEPFREREMHQWRPALATDRTLEVVHGDRVVATSTGMARTMTMPYADRPVPTAAVTAVTVEPEHRRQGLMRAMMLRMLDDARRAGEPLAALYASEAPIYGRFGFGPAVEMSAIDIPTRRVAWHHPPDLRGRLRVASPPEATGVMVDAARLVARERPGLLDLGPQDLSWLRADPEEAREGGAERQHVLIDGGRGAVAYRVHVDWSDSVSRSRLKVHALWAVDAATERALVAYCCAVDLVETVELRYRPVDDWLPLAVDDHVQLRIRRDDPLYVRILDVPSALEARGSAAPGAVVVEVHDPLYGERNSGRWRWETGPGGSACTRTEDEPDAAMDVRELGSLVLGGVSARQLAAAGRLVPRDDVSLARLTDAFHAVPAPWSPITF